MHNIIYIQQKGSGGDRINIAIEHNLVQPNKYLLNKLKGKKEKWQNTNNSNNTIMGGRQMDVQSGQ